MRHHDPPFVRRTLAPTHPAARLLVGFGGGAAWLFFAGPDDGPGKVAFLLWLLFAYLAALVTETVTLARGGPATGATGGSP